MKNVQAAAASAKIPEDYYVRFTYVGGKESYPIAGFTFLLVPKNLTAAKANALKGFMKWAYEKGDKDAVALDYVPLPDKLTKKVLSDLAKEVK
jgi:phosphate transport system substrate-binding protein